MRFTIENYFHKIKEVNFENLPIKLINGHEYIEEVTGNGNDWTLYNKDKDVREAIDLYFLKLEEFLSLEGGDIDQDSFDGKKYPENIFWCDLDMGLMGKEDSVILNHVFVAPGHRRQGVATKGLIYEFHQLLLNGMNYVEAAPKNQVEKKLLAGLVKRKVIREINPTIITEDEELLQNAEMLDLRVYEINEDYFKPAKGNRPQSEDEPRGVGGIKLDKSSFMNPQFRFRVGDAILQEMKKAVAGGEKEFEAPTSDVGQWLFKTLLSKNYISAGRSGKYRLEPKLQKLKSIYDLYSEGDGIGGLDEVQVLILESQINLKESREIAWIEVPEKERRKGLGSKAFVNALLHLKEKGIRFIEVFPRMLGKRLINSLERQRIIRRAQISELPNKKLDDKVLHLLDTGWQIYHIHAPFEKKGNRKYGLNGIDGGTFPGEYLKKVGGDDEKNKSMTRMIGEVRKPTNEDLIFIKEFLNIAGKQISGNKLLSYINKLQKAILEGRLRKSSSYSQMIEEIQAACIYQYNKMKGTTVKVVLPKASIKRLETAVSNLNNKVSPAVAFLKEFVALQGKKIDKNKARKLCDEMQKAIRTNKITDRDPYYTEVRKATWALLDYFYHEKGDRLEIKPADLKGLQSTLSGLGFIADTGPTRNEGVKIMNSLEFAKQTFSSIGFTGKWQDLFGDPAPGFTVMVYALPKKGKSYFGVMFAGYLARNFGKVLYIAREEKLDATLLKKVHDTRVEHQNLDFAEDLPGDLSGYAFIFLDSVTKMELTAKDLEHLEAANKGKSFIYIHQSTKNGNFRGSNDFQHDVDMVVQFDRKGHAVQFGRYNQGGEMDVFEENEAYQVAA